MRVNEAFHSLVDLNDLFKVLKGKLEMEDAVNNVTIWGFSDAIQRKWSGQPRHLSRVPRSGIGNECCCLRKSGWESANCIGYITRPEY